MSQGTILALCDITKPGFKLRLPTPRAPPPLSIDRQYTDTFPFLFLENINSTHRFVTKTSNFSKLSPSWQRRYSNVASSRVVSAREALQNRKSPRSWCFESKGLLGLPLVDGWMFGASCCSEKIHTTTASEWCEVGTRTAGSVCVECLRGVYKAASFAKLRESTICLSWIHLSAYFSGSPESCLRRWN